MENAVRTRKSGFTMVELLVVLIIVAILAAIAAPIYLANVKRSIASDAVAAMSLIRQAEREYRIKNGSYTAVTNTTVTDQALYKLLGIEPEATQYFAHTAFRVQLISGTNPNFSDSASVGTPAKDFLITANGSTGGAVATDGQNVLCTSAVTVDCAAKANNGDVANMRLEMDNTGRTRISYGSGAAGTWENY